MNKKIVVFAPHPDDGTLGCGGIIAKKLGQGYEIVMVYMTDGEHAFSKMFSINSDPTPNELSEIRREEARRAAGVLGLQDEHLFFLGFEDGELDQKTTEAKERVIKILSKWNPVEVYFPYEKDFHPDHRETNKIVISAIEKIGLPILKYRYSITYAYAHVRSLFVMLLNLFKHNLVGVDISEFLAQKEAAIKEFRSQITIISNKQERPIVENIKRFLKSNEVFFV